jgi:hypothetical protein
MVHDFEDGDVAKSKSKSGCSGVSIEGVMDVSVELERQSGHGTSRRVKKYLERFADEFEVLFWGVARWPWLPPPRLESTEVALALSCIEAALIEAYVWQVE